jgi:hypothetical protein
MYVTLKAKVDLPDDHPTAPWKAGETREMLRPMAEVLMRERTEDFEIVEPKPAKSTRGQTQTAVESAAPLAPADVKE